MWRDDDVSLAGLRDLQRQAEELAVQLSAAAGAGGAEFIGSDSAGAVEVTIDSSGAPVRVRLAGDWSRIVGMAGLGPAVVEAMQAAVYERLTAWATGAADVDIVPPATTGSVTTDQVERAEIGDPSSQQSAYAIRDLIDLVDGVLDRMDALQEAAESAARRSVTSTNLARTVRVVAVGGTMESVEFDEDWLRSTHQHEHVADAIREALQASWRAAAEEKQRLYEAVPGMERLRQLVDSPETLLREIGFLR